MNEHEYVIDSSSWFRPAFPVRMLCVFTFNGLVRQLLNYRKNIKCYRLTVGLMRKVTQEKSCFSFPAAMFWFYFWYWQVINHWKYWFWKTLQFNDRSLIIFCGTLLIKLRFKIPNNRSFVPLTEFANYFTFLAGIWRFWSLANFNEVDLNCTRETSDVNNSVVATYATATKNKVHLH